MNADHLNDDQQWNRKLDLLIDGSLPYEEAQLLQERMKIDGQLLQSYVEKMQMESLLRDHVWKEPDDLSQLRRPTQWWALKPLRQIAAVAAILIISATGLWWIAHESNSGNSLVAHGFPNIQFSAASVFETSSPAVSEDGQIRFGDGVIMSDGTVSIRLPSGVEAVLKSPSRFSITGPNRLKLDQGTGWFRVPVTARGFAVDLPNMEVIDLGTVFTVVVGDSQEQVHVEQGKVEIHPRSGDQNIKRVIAGEMLLRRSNASMIEVVSSPSLYRPDSTVEHSEVIFSESLNHVPDQSFAERKPIVGAWQVMNGEAFVKNGKFMGRTAPFTHLMGRFSRPVEAAENAIILLTFRSVSPKTLFHSQGFAGVSLFDGDGEIFFLGDKARNSYSWNLITYGRQFRRERGTDERKYYDLSIQGSQETFTLRYRQRDGRFDVFRGDGVNGLPIVIGQTDPRLRFDGVRVATGLGGDFSFDRVQVSVVKDTAL